MKHILVPTDFSKNATDALFYATRLFKNQECTFYILNTFEVKTPVFTSRINTNKGKELYKKLSAESESHLKETLHSIVRVTEDYKHTFKTISISKPLISTIEKTIAAHKIDLLVMGTKGASGIKEIFMGSNTVKTIEAINSCPILAVPENVDCYPIYHIAFATDFSYKYKKDSLKTLHYFCDLENAILKIIYVSDHNELTEEQYKNRSELEQYFKSTKHGSICINKNKSLEKEITNITSYLEFDMLAMIKYRHGFIKKLTHEAVIKKIGHRTKIPFLIIPDKLINVIYYEPVVA